MEIQLSIPIDRSPSEVFHFIMDMRNHPQEEGSKVQSVEKVTEGEIDIGTQFSEAVRMFPFLSTHFFNEITQIEIDKGIEITWHGGGMAGVLRFHLDRHGSGTLLKLQEIIHLKGVMKWVEPMIEKNFRGMWEQRLQGIQRAMSSTT